MTDQIEVRVNGSIVWANTAQANTSSGSVPSQPAIRLLIGERVEVSLAANQVQEFVFDHMGGVMELKVDAAPGKGTWNTLTESLAGPGSGFTGQKITPAGTVKSHTVVNAPMPPGLYTYSVSADIDTVLHVFKNQ